MAKKPRTWRCQRVRNGVKCATDNPRTKVKCAAPGCTGRRPKPAVRAHEAERDATTYEQCVAMFGEQCGICSARPKPGGRRLHRDHDHRTGELRGLLCFRCNSVLRPYMTLDWMRAAVRYLERAYARKRA